MAQELESYLVKLGFNIDKTGLDRFNGTLESVNKSMSSTVFKLGGDFAKLQFGITSALLSVGAASAKVALDFADFDQRMRLGAMSAFLTKSAFTSMNEALKLAGVTLAEASWDPEANARFLQGVELVERLQKSLGPDAEENARKIRDLKFQFSALGEEVKYLGFATGSDLFGKLFGGGDAQKALQTFNEWLINNIPKLADEISTELVPIMHDLWDVTKDTGEVFKDAFAIFQEIVGVLSGDTSLQTTAVTFESVAKSVEHTVEWVDGLLKSILALEKALLTLDFTKLTGGDLAHIGEAAMLTGTGRKLAWKGLKGLGGLLTGGGAEAAAGESAAAEAGTGIGIPLAVATGLGIAGYEGYKHWDSIKKLFQSRQVIDAGLPPGLLEALVKQESGGHQFDKNGNVLRSSAGALGLTQLMPATARGLGVDPNDAEQNLRGGATLLAQLIAHYGGSEVKALAAYNWGEGNLDRALRAHNGAFAMSYLPAETRGYVRNIEGTQGRGVTNGGDTYTLNVYPPKGADASQVANLVMDRLQDQQAKQSRFSQARSVGSNQ